ncbi:ribosome recycling factor [SAR202 cluster bacterium AC-409-J13_OGT_754m]|nr:ribosome recycling factor [SAR202 cluster bacterium AC-409-J13_OGT_754m]
MNDETLQDNATPEDLIANAEHRMTQAIEFLKRSLSAVRTGRASPSLVENLPVSYYGTSMPLNQLSNITTPDAQLLLIQPWDKGALHDIEKAILTSPSGLNPSNDGIVIRIPIPPLSQERREELVKSLGKLVEDGKVAVRNVRRNVQDKIRGLEKDKQISQDEEQRSQNKLQEQTNNHIAQIDTIWTSKVTELMKV